MIKRFSIWSTAMALAVWVFSGASALACSCIAGGPPCQAYGSTAAVFTGTPVEVKTVKVKQNSGGREYDYDQRVFTFRVEEAFRGVKEGEVQIMTGRGGGDCGYQFQIGERYLVYAGRGTTSDTLYASICTRTRPLAEAGEDLEYIRGLSKRKPGATLSGEVRRYRRNLETEQQEQLGPLGGVEILVTGEGKSYTARTDEGGRYHLADLAPGSYTIRLTLPEKLSTSELKREAVLSDRGCADVSFYVTDNGQIKGRVVDSEGKPVPRMMINLVPVSQADSLNPHSMFDSADDEGRFSLKWVPPGSYLLGIRLNGLGSPDDPEKAYPRTYYPGVAKAAEAMVITIGEGEVVKDLELRLPPRLATRTISGRVVLADGRPTIANVAQYEVAYTARGLGYSFETDAAGNFSFTGYEGIPYLVNAHINTDRGQMHAEPVEVPANGPVSNLRLVISEPGGTCARCREIIFGQKQKRQP